MYQIFPEYDRFRPLELFTDIVDYKYLVKFMRILYEVPD